MVAFGASAAGLGTESVRTLVVKVESRPSNQPDRSNRSIAGSIREPAACCGLYGFRPSAGRLPYIVRRSCDPR